MLMLNECSCPSFIPPRSCSHSNSNEVIGDVCISNLNPFSNECFLRIFSYHTISFPPSLVLIYFLILLLSRSLSLPISLPSYVTLYQLPILLPMSLFESLSVSSKCELKNVKCVLGWNQRECCLQPPNSWPKTLFTCYASLFLLNEFILCIFYFVVQNVENKKKNIYCMRKQ